MTKTEFTAEPDRQSIVITRTFDAPRERVFRAFTDPDDLERWYTPGDTTTEVHALEPERDGAFSLTFVDGDERTDIEGTFVEVVENERIVHTWRYPGEEESRVSYEFRDVDDGTEVALTHERVGPYRPSSEREERSTRENVDGYVEGWSSALENLETVVVQE